jgi:predicted metalloendopeptidase
MTTFKRVLEEAQYYAEAAHAQKTEDWKGHFARMLAYIGVSRHRPRF